MASNVQNSFIVKENITQRIFSYNFLLGIFYYFMDIYQDTLIFLIIVI